jgi:hypothetical protein
VADKYIAQGMIRWGPKDKAEKDGKAALVVFYDGDEVKGPDEDEMQQLIDAGAVVKQSDLDKRQAPGSDMEEEYRKQIAARDDEIAELKTRLAAAEANKGSQAGSGTSTAGGKATQTTSK